MKEIWMYLLPSGFIASLLTWLVNRRRERLKDIKEEHSVYRELYEDLRVLIKKQSAEYAKLRNKVFRLERAFEEINRCPYRQHCPLLHGLPVDEADREVGTADPDRADRTRGDPAP
ncbi:MAG: hypothetical protein ACRCZQ_10920 [Bacteroidales bacterium]